MLAPQSVHVIPRASAQDAFRSSSPVEVDLATLKSKLGMRLSDAAKSLGISMTTFKQVCRKLGVARWPRRLRPRSGAQHSGSSTPDSDTTEPVVAGSRKRPADAMDPSTSCPIGSHAEINHKTFKSHIPPPGTLPTFAPCGHSFQPISSWTTSPPVGTTQKQANTLLASFFQTRSPWHIPELHHVSRQTAESPTTPVNGFSHIEATCFSATEQRLSTGTAHSPTLNHQALALIAQRYDTSRISTASGLQAPTLSQTHSQKGANKQAHPQRPAQAQTNAYRPLKGFQLLEQIEATEKHLASLKDLQEYLAFPSLGALLCEKRFRIIA